MRHRSHVLHTLLEGFVLRRGHEILRSTLPPKSEHVLLLRPSPLQGVLYNHAMEQVQSNQGGSSSAGPLKAFALCSKVGVAGPLYSGLCVGEGREPLYCEHRSLLYMS